MVYSVQCFGLIAPYKRELVGAGRRDDIAVRRPRPGQQDAVLDGRQVVGMIRTTDTGENAALKIDVRSAGTFEKFVPGRILERKGEALLEDTGSEQNIIMNVFFKRTAFRSKQRDGSSATG